VCGGRGVTIDDPCPTCRGTGVERRPREVKVRVPAGVDDGQRIRLKGRGGPGRNGGPPGDLYVVVHVAAHPLFKRKGRDLTLTVPVTFPEATLGADIAVPTLAGPPVTLRVPPGTRTGRTFRVKGKGIGGAKGAGDLLATVEVAVPANLSSAERKAVEALQAASNGDSPRAHLGV
jgi:molecular chaperone DnaJ